LRTLGFGATVAAAALLFAVPLAASGIRGYDDSFADAVPAVLQEIDPATGNASVPGEYSGCAFSPPNTVFSVSFTSGLDFVGATLYGLEWNGGSGPDIYLYTLAPSGCATGTRVGVTPVGFTNLEALAYDADDGFLYSADFDFAAHNGNLIRIDPATGVGTEIGGPMITDLRIVGLAWDPLTGILYGVTSAWATRSTELVTIDTETGVATVVGTTGTAANSIESLAIDLAGGPAQLIGAGATLYAIDPATGAASAIGDTFNGTIWAMTESHAVIFGDGFETGDRSRWSASSP
jgi:hypothetical protein